MDLWLELKNGTALPLLDPAPIDFPDGVDLTDHICKLDGIEEFHVFSEFTPEPSRVGLAVEESHFGVDTIRVYVCEKREFGWAYIVDFQTASRSVFGVTDDMMEAMRAASQFFEMVRFQTNRLDELNALRTIARTIQDRN